MNECTIEQCNQGSKCDPSSPYACLTNGGCSNDPNLWINSPACNDFCDATNCTRSYKCNPATQICEKTQYLPDAYQHRFATEKQCYDGSKSCIPQNPKPAPKPGPKPGPAPDNGPRWCDYSGGVCRIPDAGMSANFNTRVDCERDCKALIDTKFSCTENGCVISDDGPFRATHRNPGNGTYYSEECESNCKFGKGLPDHSGGMRRTFFENKESTLWDKPDNYGCATFPCTKDEIDALKWVRMQSLQQWHDNEGSTLCRPVSDKMMEDKTKYPVGTPTYQNPLDCHNAFGNAGFFCYVDGGFCRMDESKNVGSTLESCHKRCTASGDPTDYWIWNGEECVKTSPDTPGVYHRLENCLDNNASYSCTGAAGNYTCEPTVNGEYNRPTMARSDCASDCHPPGHGI